MCFVVPIRSDWSLGRPRFRRGSDQRHFLHVYQTYTDSSIVSWGTICRVRRNTVEESVPTEVKMRAFRNFLILHLSLRLVTDNFWVWETKLKRCPRYRERISVSPTWGTQTRDHLMRKQLLGQTLLPFLSINVLLVVYLYDDPPKDESS